MSKNKHRCLIFRWQAASSLSERATLIDAGSSAHYIQCFLVHLKSDILLLSLCFLFADKMKGAFCTFLRNIWQYVSVYKTFELLVLEN